MKNNIFIQVLSFIGITTIIAVLNKIYKLIKQQYILKNKIKIFTYIKNHPCVTTSDICTNVYNNKIKIDTLYILLQELQYEQKLYSIKPDGSEHIWNIKK